MYKVELVFALKVVFFRPSSCLSSSSPRILWVGWKYLFLAIALRSQYKLEPELEADPRSFASLRGVRKSSAKADPCGLFHPACFSFHDGCPFDTVLGHHIWEQI